MKSIRIGSIISCCHGCNNRSMGCHSRCDLYRAEREKQDYKNHMMAKQNRPVKDVLESRKGRPKW